MTFPVSLTEQIRALAKGEDKFFPAANLGTIKMIFIRLHKKHPRRKYRRKTEKNGIHVKRER